MKIVLNRGEFKRESVFHQFGADRASVDLTHDDDLVFWKRYFNCSSEKLLAGVESVGPGVPDIAAYLRAGW